MKTNKILLILALCLSVPLMAQTKKDKQVIDDAQAAKSAFIDEDSSLKSFFDSSTAYVIFPNVGKGALVVGASSGRGAVYENGILIGMAKMKKLDVGLQAGGKAFSEVIFFNDKTALERFKDDDFEFTGNASAVVLKSGAARNAKYRDGVAVFAKPKAGLMVDLSVGGQKFDYRSL
ncbi:MAG: lipid-binding SYLF domain-containing protein [Leeuwenhoekiella sp.]